MPNHTPLAILVAAGLAVSACEAPQVSRASPVPLFNKSGEAMCRPENRPISTNYPARLPICEDICEDREQYANVADIVICPPVVVPRQPGGRDDDDDDEPGRDGQQTP
jgi:hypothetical protein